MINKPDSLIVPVFLGRVSSEDQAERGTIQNQVEFAKKYADLHQFDISDWYLDDGVTGTIPLEQRPEGKRLLDDAKAGKFNLLLIYKLDRLGRSARIVLNSVHELESYNVKIKSMTEPFDTGDPSGRFLLTILAGVADLERETILERMWHGANRAARNGKWLSGIVPYGYHVNQEGFLEITETPIPGFDLSEADIIEMMYRLSVEPDYTCCQIADYFNALGFPPSYVKDGRQIQKGKRKENTAGIWRPGRIRNMIVNETYKGIHKYGKRTKKEREIITRQVPAIVPDELWTQAQQALKDHKLECVGNSKHQYLLRGLIKCASCGSSLCGTTYWGQRDGKKRKYKSVYRCNGKMKYQGLQCKLKNVPADWIEEMVWSQITELANNPKEAVKSLSSADKKQKPNNIERESEILTKAISDKDAERTSILDLFRRKIISQSEVEAQLNKINTEKEQLALKLQDFKKEIITKKAIADQTYEIEFLLSKVRNKIKANIPFEEKREIIKSLVSKIIINQDGQKIVADIHFIFLKS
jgi:site-specific DNA recombinase